LSISNPFPNGLNPIVGSSLGLLAGLGTSFESPLYGDNLVPYTQNWDFEIQQQLPRDILLYVSYVGSHSVHINQATENDFNMDQLTPQALAGGATLQQSVRNPFFGIITTGPESAATIPLSYLATPFPQYSAVDASYPGEG
jgi:hypothetical protein